MVCLLLLSLHVYYQLLLLPSVPVPVLVIVQRPFWMRVYNIIY